MNFVEMSSGNCLYQGREKLKVLLEKRKTSFNELEELKKEWDLRRQKVVRNLEVECQKKELGEID